MKRFIIILLIINAFNLNVFAGNKGNEAFPRITYGLEWGYVATIHTGHHYYFFAPEGYRVEDRDNSFGYSSNADMYIHLGYNFSTRWNLSLYVGYEGISNIHKAVPVSLRMTGFFNADPTSDRWFSFIDIGSGICLKVSPQEIMTGKLGAGYRLSLSRTASLDFMLSGRFIYTHPQIIYDKTLIPLERTNRNNAYVSAVSLGMALNF